MKHLLVRLVGPKPNYILRSLLFHSSRTIPSPLDPYDTLQRRVARAGDPSASIINVLEGWLDQGNLVKSSELHSIIKMLRRFSRFSHALQISDWMTEHRVHDISQGDVAIRLDLIAKVGGLGDAEKFFETIPVERRNYHLYGALLNCYASKKVLHKAEHVFQEMKELGFLKGCLPYNVMLNLYIRTGKYTMVEKLLREMDDEAVKPDIFTVNTRLHAYSVVSDLDGMEKFLMRCTWRLPHSIANQGGSAHFITHTRFVTEYPSLGLCINAARSVYAFTCLTRLKRRKNCQFTLAILGL